MLRRRFVYFLFVIVSVVIILLLFVLDDRKSEESLFAIYFRPYEKIVEPVSMDTEGSDALSIFYQMYGNEKFQEALEVIDSIDNSQLRDEDFFFKSVAMIASGRTGEATLLLRDLSESNEFRFLDQSLWYLALAYLAEQNTTGAKTTLQEIMENPDHYKFKEASKVLQFLD